MKIALDYDETYTEDREGWDLFVGMMKRRGHEITFVTFRQGPSDNPNTDNADILGDAEKLGIKIVFTCHKQKAHVFKADVWIDDSPQLIVSYKQLAAMKLGCEVNRDTEESLYLQ